MTVFHTKGVVLRTVKYGETSLIVTIYTELFGTQSYLINGVRTTMARGGNKAAFYQPGALLDLMVYHNELKQLQRIKECRWHIMYQHLFFDVIKNSVGTFMIELLQKTLRQPEPNPDLFDFIEDAFVHLDAASPTVVANFALFFALHLSTFYGFRFSDTYTGQKNILDLQEGQFTDEAPAHPYFLDGHHSYTTSQLLKVMQPYELEEIRLNQETRRLLLQAYADFYALHVPEFGTMRTLQVLQDVLS